MALTKVTSNADLLYQLRFAEVKMIYFHGHDFNYGSVVLAGQIPCYPVKKDSTKTDTVKIKQTCFSLPKGKRLHCFLPTRKIVDDIYGQARVKLEPMPMYAFRDSTPTMYHHHLIIEGLRKQRKGVIAGIKKDVVISGKIARGTRSERVAIYGWHKPDGKPIQPLYTGHVNWFDLSTGARNNGEKNNKSCPGTNFIGGNKVGICKKYFLPLVHKQIKSSGTVIATDTTAILKYVCVTTDSLNLRKKPDAKSEKATDRAALEY